MVESMELTQKPAQQYTCKEKSKTRILKENTMT